ncbi:MAG: gamma carbonic anhydrase family protein [Gammaproteobacteria bacterium]|nr:gamma carbonic anhydrase family protein [Gammaproteobacteria bacterium]MBU1733193.1 gamma carbonic anhydrase family protein [Gammaproteobacteria bacterium]MBU1892241.1 gamma carbonic anhydrase family protein [Gammaproteobacteria bacterium]
MKPNIAAYQGIAPRLAEGVFVHASAHIIGDVAIGACSSIWCGAVIRGDVHRIRIGAESNIQDLSVLHVSHKSAVRPEGAPLLIGDRVTVGHRVILHGCEIGDECLIGMGSIIMDHAVLEPRVLLGAGSLVPEGKRLKSGHLYLGSPVRELRPLTADELAYFSYSAAHYVRLQQSYQAG